MVESADIEWIRKGLAKKGKTQTGLARAMNIAHSQISRLLSGDRQLKAREIPVIAAYLEELPPSGPTRKIRITGYVAAGAEIFELQEDENETDLNEVDAPPGATEDMVAVEVRGDSLPGYAEDAWVVYYRNRKENPDDSMIGKLCVVWLPDGKQLIRKLYPGREPGLFNLLSTTSEPMFDTTVKWAARVEFIAPR